MRLFALALILFVFNAHAENPKLFLKNVPINNNLVVGLDLEAIIALQNKFGLTEADEQIETFKDFMGIEPSQLSSLIIAGSGDFANPNNESGFMLLKGNAALHAEKVLHSFFNKQEGMKAKETKFNNHPVYLVETSQMSQDPVAATPAMPVKDIYLSNLSEDTLLVGTKKSLKEVLSTVKFDKMLNITSSSQMMKIMDDEPALLFVAFSFENFLSTTAGQALAINPVAQGLDMESLLGLMFNADYKKETGHKLSLNLSFFSIDARKAFETKVKQLRNQQQEAIQHGKLEISGGSNKLSVTYSLSDEDLKNTIKSIRSQVSGVPLEEVEEIEEELEIPEEIE
ncbi:transcription termination factor Rho [Lentisphaera araneosa HTCC2155]|uniref:Transcription termination factor Rho n=1 Tax=Lentisphaera araneosa HTCC2155 TaxID=313628 RepID=A6DIN3_9BACT|nr:hypothetical protein [Lentisphaera araneosa]EDM28319.1 transcription termination factor Rho [Lentisphaera araneosa HTCC2155]